MSTLESKGISNELVLEGERVMRLCNACRYCEGFCAVFPAMERRITFSESDLNYLANLCHNCTECYYACQYAPPQVFELNFPKTLAEIRLATYRKYAWPGPLAHLFTRNGLATGFFTVFGLLAVLALVLLSPMQGAEAAGAGFYSVISHGTMVATFSLAAAFAALACLVGFARFWTDTDGGCGKPVALSALLQALGDTLRLKYLDGTDSGCAYPDELPSNTRRVFHHLAFYGFLLCFGATATGTVFHYLLGWTDAPPFPHLGMNPNEWVRALPLLLGSVGGVGLVVGPSGLLWLKTRRNALLADQKQNGMDAGFLVLLILTSLTGFALTVLRGTPALSALVVLHLGVVLALFLAMPYGKMVHGLYRFGALLRNAVEQRTMPKLGSE